MSVLLTAHSALHFIDMRFKFNETEKERDVEGRKTDKQLKKGAIKKDRFIVARNTHWETRITAMVRGFTRELPRDEFLRYFS